MISSITPQPRPLVFKFAEQATEGSAVFHNGKWYGYDPVKMQPFGSPLEEFTPAIDGEAKGIQHFINKVGSIVAPTPPAPDLPMVFEKTAGQAKLTELDAYILGYQAGNADPEYKVSEFNELGLMATTRNINSLTSLFATSA